MSWIRCFYACHWRPPGRLAYPALLRLWRPPRRLLSSLRIRSCYWGKDNRKASDPPVMGIAILLRAMHVLLLFAEERARCCILGSIQISLARAIQTSYLKDVRCAASSSACEAHAACKYKGLGYSPQPVSMFVHPGSPALQPLPHSRSLQSIRFSASRSLL